MNKTNSYNHGFISTLKRSSLSDKVFYIFCFVWLSLAGIIVLYPCIYVVACSFSSTQAIFNGRVFLWPVEPSLKAYQGVLKYAELRYGFLNSLIYVAGGTITSVVLLLLGAYPLSRRDLPGRKFFLYFFVVTMFFSGGIIPNYILVRSLRMTGTRWSQVIPFMFSCYNMIIVKSYFQSSLPPGLLDAARIDGCNDLQYFVKVALPLAVPVIAVMVLFNAVGIWNSYFNAMLFLSRANTYNYQQVLREILFIAQMPQQLLQSMDPDRVSQMRNLMLQLRYSVLVVGALPMMLLYPFIQRYFIRGMMIGSLKE
jgi:multiple sugar transport system permease protein/putative aldouronate transport system permease protein